jgi:hypothetical protein
MVLSAGYVSNVEADSESLNDQEINEIVSGLSSADLQKLVQTAEKKGKLSTAKSKKTGKKKKKKKKKNAQNYQSNELIQNGVPNANVDNINADQPAKKKRKKKKKKKNKQQNILQNSVITDNNAYTGDINNLYQNQSSTKKKKKKKKKKNKQNNALQNAEFVTNVKQNRSISKNASDQSAIFANKEDAKRSYQLNKNKKENNADESWKYEVISASDLINRGELTTINEPVIDKTKIQKSSIVVEKDIKLASSSEKAKFADKITPQKLSSSNTTVKLASIATMDKSEKKIAPLKLLDNEKLLNHLASEKDVNLLADLSNCETSIKDKLKQLKNYRETYNLIKTPNKDLKDNIQVKKFRAELDHYRKIYASNMEKA